MAKKTEFIPFSSSFWSKMGFSKVNISKTAWETYPQNFTMIFTCLKPLKKGLSSLEEFFPWDGFWLNPLDDACHINKAKGTLVPERRWKY